ncbi:hypothetical protein CMV_019602, partial [Castanea mollissima]
SSFARQSHQRCSYILKKNGELDLMQSWLVMSSK